MSRPSADARPAPSPLERARKVAAGQEGAVSRAQLLAAGMTEAEVATQVRAGRWQRVHPGTYVTFTGPLPYPTRVRAALLYAGGDAHASHETAAWLQGLVDDPPAQVVVTIGWDRRVRRQTGLRIVRSRGAASSVHAARTPRQTRLEETVLDLVAASRDVESVVGWLTRACQRRLTTARRLARAADRRRRLRWRSLVREVLTEVADGVLTPLERRYARDVEGAHGLPRGTRNRAEGSGSRRRYRDVRYERFRLVVELDGKVAHPDDGRHRDRRRDNAVTVAGDVTLRYGFEEVAGSPCDCAAEVVAVVRAAGWTGRPRRCGPHCPVGA